MRDSRPFRIIVWIALGVIPMIYAGLLVWSNQDPTGHLSRVPAAIVNEDTGTTTTAADGTTTSIDLGDRLTTDLTTAEEPAFDWRILDADSAAQQLADSAVLAVLTIPSGFSADAMSSASPDPGASAESGELEIRTDDAENFIVGTVAKSIATAVSDALSTEVRKAYLEGVYESFGTLAEQLDQAADGGSQLAAGASSLEDGTRQLATGASQLSTGADALERGASQVATGASQLSSGLERLASSSQALAAGTSSSLTGAQQLQSSLSALAANWAALPDAQREAIVEQLASGAGQLVGSAAGGTGLSALSAGASQLATGASGAASSAVTLSAGAEKASSGASSIADGAASLSSAAPSAVDGSAQLAAGASTLSAQLSEGAARIPAYTSAEAAARAAIAAQPVLLDAVRDHDVGVYGAGLLPYFLSLGLWVGALGTFMMRAPLAASLLRRRSIPAALVALRSFWPTALLGLAQALAAVLVLRFWVGIPMADLPAVGGIAALTSLTFMAVNQGLVGLFGPPGRFLALLLVVLQLAAAGGTYPVQTAAPFFQTLHPWLPVTHSMNAFRQLVAGGGQSVVPDVLVLLAWLVGGLVLATLGVLLERRHRDRGVAAPEDEIDAELEGDAAGHDEAGHGDPAAVTA